MECGPHTRFATPLRQRNQRDDHLAVGRRIRFCADLVHELEDAGKPVDYLKVIASVEVRERPDRPDPWHGVERADQLASAIHDAALGKYPESDYAKLYGQPSEC